MAGVRWAEILKIGRKVTILGYTQDGLLKEKKDISLNGLLLGMLYSTTNRCVDNIIALADIGEFISDPINTSGMRARLSFSISYSLDTGVYTSKAINIW
jgi:ABC-type polysaccharide/polyol phosphate transport system ATPase subunit